MEAYSLNSCLARGFGEAPYPNTVRPHWSHDSFTTRIGNKFIAERSRRSLKLTDFLFFFFKTSSPLVTGGTVAQIASSLGETGGRQLGPGRGRADKRRFSSTDRFFFLRRTTTAAGDPRATVATNGGHRAFVGFGRDNWQNTFLPTTSNRPLPRGRRLPSGKRSGPHDLRLFPADNAIAGGVESRRVFRTISVSVERAKPSHGHHVAVNVINR